MESILKSIIDNGKSDELTNLYYDDYDEIPVSIEEFLTNDEYLGNYTNHGKDIYATWLEELKYVHNPLTFCDQWAITGSTGTGKAQPLTSRILTPNGYVLMKNIQIGDTIIDGDGDLTKVTHIYPQGKLPVYRITLTDNTEVLSADNHLWVLRDLNSFSKKLKVVELSEILNTDMKSGNTYRYELPNTKINCFNKTIEFNPYILAYLFNNYKLNKHTNEIEVLDIKQEHIATIRELLSPYNYTIRKKGSKYYIYSKQDTQNILLKNLIELSNLSEPTFTKEIRLQMLKGFIDKLSTKKGTLDVKDLKTSNHLSFLVRTLGGIDKTYIKPKEVRRKDLPTKAAYYYYEHKIRLPKELNLGYTITSKLSRRIKKIEYIGKTECQCIVVDSPNHCYITDTEVVTHNSTVATYSMCYELYKLLCLKNPNRYYLGAQETIWILFFNLSLGLAEKTMFGKFQKAVQSSPWFMKNGTVTGRTNLVYQPHKDVKIGLGSTEEHALSIAVMFCLAGDTEIYTENGFIPIEQLKDKEIKVYTLNKDGTTQLTNEPVVVKQTGITNELYEITLENGHKFRCTPDHKMLLIDGEYKEAYNLNLDDIFIQIDSTKQVQQIGISKIKKIKVDNVPVYDVINVPKNHNFLIQGHYNKNTHTCIISHNCGIDEMSFGNGDNADYKQAGMMKIYNQLYLRLSSRFSKGGKIQGRMYLVSSAKSTNAVLESFIEDNKNEPGMHVSRYKQWEVLPASKFSGKWFKLAVGNDMLQSFIMGVNVTEEQVKEAELKGYQVIDCPLETLHRFEMDLNRTLIDTCGIAIQSSYKYIPFRLIEPCIGKGENPVISEIIKTGMKDNKQISDFFLPEKVPELLYSKKLYIHCDLSKSGDNTGISCVAVLGYKNQERYTETGEEQQLKEIVFRHVFTLGIKCPANDELSMIKVKDFLHYLKYTLGWNIAGVSCDGYQSLMLLQSLRLDGFNTKEVSMDIVKDNESIGYTTFRNTLVEKRIKLLKLDTLIKELINLEKNESTGKVDHPKQSIHIDKDTGELIKSVGKDLADSLGGAIYNATLSVDIKELDNISNVILSANQDTNNIFSFIHPFQNTDLLPSENKDILDNIDDELELQQTKEKELIDNLRKTNPNIRLTDAELLNIYNNANSTGTIIF